MKKLLLLSALLFPLFVSSQNYIPIPCDSTSEWRIKMESVNKDYCLKIKDYLYYFNDDTIINSHIYKKLYMSGIHYEEAYGNITCNPTVYHFQKNYVGAIRNDSGKVYCLQPYFYEFLLFDFTLNIGDTVPGFFYFSKATTIFSIDSVLINSRYHKRFNLKYGYWIIEGIGSNFGLIESESMSLDASSEFLCYAENHIPIFPVGTNCILNVSINENKEYKKKTDLIIYPNPASDEITIDFGKVLEQDVFVEIYNITGQKVKRQKFKGKSLIQIEAKDLVHGLYLGKVIFYNGEVANFKFVVE